MTSTDDSSSRAGLPKRGRDFEDPGAMDAGGFVLQPRRRRRTVATAKTAPAGGGDGALVASDLMNHAAIDYDDPEIERMHTANAALRARQEELVRGLEDNRVQLEQLRNGLAVSECEVAASRVLMAAVREERDTARGVLRDLISAAVVPECIVCDDVRARPCIVPAPLTVCGVVQSHVADHVLHVTGDGKAHGMCGVCLRLALQNVNTPLRPAVAPDWDAQVDVCQLCREAVKPQLTVEPWIAMHVRCPLCNVCVNTRVPLDAPGGRDGRRSYHGSAMYCAQFASDEPGSPEYTPASDSDGAGEP